MLAQRPADRLSSPPDQSKEKGLRSRKPLNERHARQDEFWALDRSNCPVPDLPLTTQAVDRRSFVQCCAKTRGTLRFSQCLPLAESGDGARGSHSLPNYETLVQYCTEVG